MTTTKVKDVDCKTIKLFAKLYTSNPRYTMEQISIDYGCSRDTVSNILWRGIAENILPNSLADAIYSKVMRSFKANKKQRINRWDAAFEQREKIRTTLSEKLDNCYKLESILSYALEHYEEYCSRVSSPHSEETLQEMLSNVNICIKRCKLALA